MKAVMRLMLINGISMTHLPLAPPLCQSKINRANEYSILLIFVNRIYSEDGRLVATAVQQAYVESKL